MRGIEDLFVRESRKLSAAEHTQCKAMNAKGMFVEISPAVRHVGAITMRTVETEQQHRGVRLIVSGHLHRRETDVPFPETRKR